MQIDVSCMYEPQNQEGNVVVKSIKASLVFVILVVVASGCAHRPGGVAPSNVPIDGRKYTVVGHAVETDSCVRLLGILPLSGSNSIRTAMNEAIQDRQGDAMINITAEGYSQYWILFSRDAIIVEGDVIKFAD